LEGSTGPTGSIGVTGPTGSKSFIIQHPVDQDKYLVHACLEGPEDGVYYRGKSSTFLQENNIFSTEVKLPNYVNSFATDFTVYVSSIYNENFTQIPTISSSNIYNGTFKVYSNLPCEFNWLVCGKRSDINSEINKNSIHVHGDGPYKWYEWK
jgi:hypothetical protein